jgi:Tfp pilus assembly protein PilZ
MEPEVFSVTSRIKKSGGGGMDKDKRKFKRFDAYMSIKYSGLDNATLKGIGLSRDLCREGIKINSDKEIKEGTQLDLEISIPDDPKPIFSSGTVVWCRPSEGSNQGYDQGVRLKSMDPVDKFRVLDYAYNHWLETKVNDLVNPESLHEW